MAPQWYEGSIVAGRKGANYSRLHGKPPKCAPLYPPLIFLRLAADSRAWPSAGDGAQAAWKVTDRSGVAASPSALGDVVPESFQTCLAFWPVFH